MDSIGSWALELTLYLRLIAAEHLSTFCLAIKCLSVPASSGNQVFAPTLLTCLMIISWWVTR